MAIAPWIAPAVLAEYVHNAGIRLRRQFRGHTRHAGDAPAIIRACIEALLERPDLHREPRPLRHVLDARPVVLGAVARPLGHGDRVHASLAYALEVWTRRRSHITTTIHYFDRPGRRLRVRRRLAAAAARRAARRRRHRPRRAPSRTGSRPRSPTYDATVVDPPTGLVRSDRKYSAPTATRSRTARTRTATRWSRCSPRRSPRPAGSTRRSSAISRATTAACCIDHFWAGDHFRDALGDETVSGEANVWPFYAGVIADPRPDRGRPSRYLDANGFCDPYPLRYETIRRPEREVWLTRHVLPDYQGSTVWTSLGAMYLQVLRTVDPRAGGRARRPATSSWIERDGTFWEVLDRARPELGQPALDHDRRGVDALVGDLPRRPAQRRRGAGPVVAGDGSDRGPRRRLGARVQASIAAPAPLSSALTPSHRPSGPDHRASWTRFPQASNQFPRPPSSRGRFLPASSGSSG